MVGGVGRGETNFLTTSHNFGKVNAVVRLPRFFVGGLIQIHVYIELLVFLGNDVTHVVL